ncbi:MAG TPA: hypothetical protein VN081_03090 [Dongiaceae bacterium]|nr:hypothetical protein [Dongiaceae bacterium]
MNRHRIVPIGYPQYITDIPDIKKRRERMNTFDVVMSKLKLCRINHEPAGHHELKFTFEDNDAVGYSLANIIFNTWIQTPSGIPMLDILEDDAGEFVTGRFFEWIQPVLDRRHDNGQSEFFFHGIHSPRVTSEHVVFLDEVIRKARFGRYTTNTDTSTEDDSCPITPFVDILYRRPGGHSNWMSAFTMEGSHLVPGVKSVKSGMVMDVEARRLKQGDVFFVTDEKNNYVGDAIVAKVEAIHSSE